MNREDTPGLIAIFFSRRSVIQERTLMSIQITFWMNSMVAEPKGCAILFLGISTPTVEGMRK
jgi:hypothetical protein